MQRPHLYEAISLNRGMDEAIRGLQWLKKVLGIADGMYRAIVATPEHARAQVNLRFLAGMEQAGRRNAEHYECRESNERDSRSRTAP